MRNDKEGAKGREEGKREKIILMGKGKRSHRGRRGRREGKVFRGKERSEGVSHFQGITKRKI